MTRSGQKYIHRSFLNCLLTHDLIQSNTTLTHHLRNPFDLVSTSKSSFISDFNVINPTLSDHFMVDKHILASLVSNIIKIKIGNNLGYIIKRRTF